MKTTIPIVITTLLLILFSVLAAFMLLVILNGFSETDGGRGLIAFALWTILMIVFSGFAARWFVQKLSTRMENASAWLIGIGAVVISSLIGSIFISLGLILGAIVATISRTSL